MLARWWAMYESIALFSAILPPVEAWTQCEVRTDSCSGHRLYLLRSFRYHCCCGRQQPEDWHEKYTVIDYQVNRRKRATEFNTLSSLRHSPLVCQIILQMQAPKRNAWILIQFQASTQWNRDFRFEGNCGSRPPPFVLRSSPQVPQQQIFSIIIILNVLHTQIFHSNDRMIRKFWEKWMSYTKILNVPPFAEGEFDPLQHDCDTCHVYRSYLSLLKFPSFRIWRSALSTFPSSFHIRFDFIAFQRILIRSVLGFLGTFDWLYLIAISHQNSQAAKLIREIVLE